MGGKDLQYSRPLILRGRNCGLDFVRVASPYFQRRAGSCIIHGRDGPLGEAVSTTFYSIRTVRSGPLPRAGSAG